MLEVWRGDCLLLMQAVRSNTVPAFVTDPPYGFEFMGKAWDHGVPGVPFWKEALRIARPGAHLVAFGGTRTYHRLTCAIEDAGWEIRDCLMWLHGQGFPKSLDASKAIDFARILDFEGMYRVTGYVKAARERAGLTNGQIDEHFGLNGMAGHWTSLKEQPIVPSWSQWIQLKQLLGMGDAMDAEVERLNREKGQPTNPRLDRVTGPRVSEVFNVGRVVEEAGTPILDEAEEWDGWGTALKPAWEPIVLARKPLQGTVAQTLTAYGTGALNVDGCRIEGAKGAGVWGSSNRTCQDGRAFNASPNGEGYQSERDPGGRWPANLLLDEEAAALLDRQTGELPAVGGYKSASSIYGSFVGRKNGAPDFGYGDPGGASRFYYCAKASRREREAGLNGQPMSLVRRYGEQGQGPTPQQTPRVARPASNSHPTVKPIALMRWLLRLVTPAGGWVLDPFAGSFTTGCAAALEGFGFLGMDLQADYCEIGRLRLRHWAKVGERLRRMQAHHRAAADLYAEPPEDPAQLGLFAG